MTDMLQKCDTPHHGDLSIALVPPKEMWCKILHKNKHTHTHTHTHTKHISL